jgi:hypothetical protein
MKFQIESTNETISTHGGNLLLGKLISKSTISESVNAFMQAKYPTPYDINTGDVIVSYLGILSQSQTAYEAIEQFRNDPSFKAMLGLKDIPSCSTLRQRIDLIGEIAKSEMIELVMQINCRLIGNTQTKISPCFCNYVPLDVDVSPFDNSKTKKEGIGFTYKKVVGYAPIFAYLGQEGYCVNAELREGTQHCQSKTPEFLEATIVNAKLVTDAKILARLDSGNDSSDNMALLQRHDVDFIIKRNPRKEDLAQHFHNAEKNGKEIKGMRDGKRIFVYEHSKKPKGCKNEVRIVTFAIERTIKADGQILLFPEYEIESYFVSLPAEIASSHDVQKLYHDHGTSEQFHSELKTDLDLERLPSGKFATNAIVLTLGVFAYNLLRMIGQESLKSDDCPPTQHKIQRRRVRTVIDRYIFLAVKLVYHARKCIVKLSSFNPWLPSYTRIYKAFAN